MTNPDPLIAAIDGAASLDALEAIRVAALGKAGSVTALMKTLGSMASELRLTEGPRLNALRDAVSAAIATRKAALEAAALDARLASERLDMTLPSDGRTRRNLRRPRFRRRHRPRDRGRLA